MQLLGDDRTGRAHLLGGADEFGDLPGRVVGDAEGADLALGGELGDGGEGFGERSRAVGLVEVEEVDRVGAEPLEAALQGGPQTGGGERGLPALVGVRDPGLGRQDDPVAPARQQPGEDALALAARVAVGRVDTGDPCVERGIEHVRRSGGVHGVAERHGAEDEPGERDGDVRQGDAGGHERFPSGVGEAGGTGEAGDAEGTEASEVTGAGEDESGVADRTARGFTPRIVVGSREARRSARV